MTALLVRIFRFLGLSISLSIWTVIGAFVWTFIMIRHFSVLSFLSVLAAFGRVDMAPAIANMETAVSFYPNGFVRIFDSFSTFQTREYEGQIWPTFLKFILECYAAAIFFWLPLAEYTGNEQLHDFISKLFFPFIWAWQFIRNHI